MVRDRRADQTSGSHVMMPIPLRPPVMFRPGPERVSPHVLRAWRTEGGVDVATYSGAVWRIDDWEPLLQACDGLLTATVDEALPK